MLENSGPGGDSSEYREIPPEYAALSDRTVHVEIDGSAAAAEPVPADSADKLPPPPR